MKIFLTQLKWQFVLLQKNNIISISFGVTLIYGLLLFFLRDAGPLEEITVAMVLNDPSIIGYFFIALAIYSEIKQGIFSAIIVSPISLHHILISKAFALSIIGLICALGLAVSVRGFQFEILEYSYAVFGICFLSTTLGIVMLTFTSDFLKFSMLSIPVFLFFINLPLLQYFGAIDLGFVKYLLPIQGSTDLIDSSFSGKEINQWYSYSSVLFLIPVFYTAAYKLFSKRIIDN